MTTPELVTLRRSIERLRTSAAGVRDVFGDGPQVRRLLNDVERLEIDASELATAQPRASASSLDATPQHVPVPDTPFDASMWGDADDEGIGGYHGSRP